MIKSIKDLIPDVVVPSYVYSIEKILSTNEQIKKLLGQEVDSHNMTILGEYLQDLTQFFAITPDLLASAKYYEKLVQKHAYEDISRRIKNGDIPKEFNGLISSSAVKKYIENCNPDISYLATESERISASLPHRSDAIRSLLTTTREVYRQSLMGVKNN